MILQINKYHRTAAGETCSTVKIEKADFGACEREALKQFYAQCSNYSADETVLDWAVALIDPRTMIRKEYRCYMSPVIPSTETPV